MPRSLAEHRLRPGATYANYGQSEELRRALVAEQRGICCYCMSRVSAQWRAMKVEHWRSQDRFPALQLEYGNLLGACLGNEGHLPEEQHCDTRTGNRDLSRNPARPADRVEESIHYSGAGEIHSEDEVFDREINEVLNLNVFHLTQNRRKALESFLEANTRRGTYTKAELERWLRTWSGADSEGTLLPFAPVVVYWLRKRLARAG